MSSILSRRSFLRGLFAAPAVVAIGSLMPVRGIVMDVGVVDTAYAYNFMHQEVCLGYEITYESIGDLLFPGLRKVVSDHNKMPLYWEREFS